MRQALSELAARGLVDGNFQTGVVIKAQTPRDVRVMYRLRTELEGLAAELAAHWIADAGLLRLRQIHENFAGAVSTMHVGGGAIQRKKVHVHKQHYS